MIRDMNVYIVEASDSDDSTILGAWRSWDEAMKYIRYAFTVTATIGAYVIHRLPLGSGLISMSNEYWWGYYGDAWAIFEDNLDMKEPA